MSASWQLETGPETAWQPPQERARAGGLGSLALVPDTAAAGDGKTLTGRFSIFDTWQEIREAGGRFLEQIQRGAFSKTIAERGTRIPLLYSHGKDFAVGGVAIGRLLEIGEDDASAYYRAELFPSVSPLLLPTSTVSELKLLDVGPTSVPAYPQTSAQSAASRRRSTPFPKRHPPSRAGTSRQALPAGFSKANPKGVAVVALSTRKREATITDLIGPEARVICVETFRPAMTRQIHPPPGS